MRSKELKLLITFSTTTGAMAMEDAARKKGFPGRLIPLPEVVRAGCGLAWMAPPEYGSQAEAFLTRHGLSYESICHITL